MNTLEKALQETVANEIDSAIKRAINNMDLSEFKNNEEYLQALIAKNARTLDIKVNKKKTVSIENPHHMFEIALRHLATGEPVFLTGPAGSGKSTIAEHAAKALELPFASISVCAQTTKSDFLGYNDANGSYCKTLFRDIYEGGGVFLIDEIDAGNPNVLAVLNAALAGHQFAFPDGVVKRHDNFLIVATANTLGKGSTEYIGRNQLDAATLDRFNFLHVNYDDALEATIMSKHKNTLSLIRNIRAFVLEKNMRIIVSTRSLIKIKKLLEAKFALTEALECTLFKTCDEDAKQALFRHFDLGNQEAYQAARQAVASYSTATLLPSAQVLPAIVASGWR